MIASTTVANSHPPSTTSGDHDRSWTTADQTNTTDTDPNQHGACVYSQ